MDSANFFGTDENNPNNSRWIISFERDLAVSIMIMPETENSVHCT
jgi:hypothetical protein